MSGHSYVTPSGLGTAFAINDWGIKASYIVYFAPFARPAPRPCVFEQ